MTAIKLSFANVGLSEHEALAAADLLFEVRTYAAQRAGMKIREQAWRKQRGELTEEVQLTSDEQAALLDVLDALSDERMQ
jgi:hypothetical protein